jgi:serpin B
MNKTEWLSYADTGDSKIVELPYKNVVDRFSKDGEYLDTEFFDDLDVSIYLVSADSEINAKAVLDTAINNNQFSRQRIKLSMPKFRIEYETELNDILMAMGITTAFDADKADFSNMFDSGNMFFSFVLHKTYIDVDEKGTEAAAVTAIGMKATSAMPQEPIELKFDKPFHFIIRDNISGEILFMGRFAFGS